MFNLAQHHLLDISRQRHQIFKFVGLFQQLFSPTVELRHYRKYSRELNIEKIMACLPFYAKGNVSKGFGRGSKELGIPTANLPEDVVKSLPCDLETGVYYGLANINCGQIHKTVLSIGWNPFYHNIKKSLEAHLIGKFDKDFYGAELRLVILGYIRQEQNYPSLELLIEAINNDIEIAKIQLDKKEFTPFYSDNFFKFTPDRNDTSNNMTNGNI